MASSLLHLFFFIIFLIILYFINYYPTNKLQMSLKNLNTENIIIKQQNNNIPTFLDTIIFTKPESAIPTRVNVYYDSALGIVTILENNKKRIFRLDFEEDVRTLLPILLLSK
ncbi:SPV049 hypothetical protein [Swinepox virus]|uniref:Entry-fusion complex protein OPG086 n=1 Tax=Swinepox virus (strain Swine/Nebraska/17077-99/1999) TaxID=300880 RepID=Q8V3P6_SWPV1|nr:Hypothetical protein SWPVgp048 [Swinepox virus]AAL69787.1 SPV049 hypothetical protein [Swinepox virus]UED36665.1 hypothetical protein SPVwb_048 [Swinepox virus]UED36813.1 hypothetical protein SPVdp_050 [Swinepox virus]UUA44238.1 SPV049 [Swinepox virus]